jgi:hypothetical protein
MALVDRIRRICLTPKSEWDVIAGEQTSFKALFRDYAVPLSLVGPVAGFLGSTIIGQTYPVVGHLRVPFVDGLVTAVLNVVLGLVSVFLLGLIIDALAPRFAAEKNQLRATQVAVYSFTPAWVAGALYLLPALGPLAMLAGLYGFYLLFLGLPRLMKCPQEKAVPYTVAVAISAVLLSFAISLLVHIQGGTP